MLTQHTFFGNCDTECAQWQVTRKGCTTFTCTFSALRHILKKPPQGTGSSGGACPRPREHQVLSLRPTCPQFSRAGQPPHTHGQPQEMGLRKRGQFLEGATTGHGKAVSKGCLAVPATEQRFLLTVHFPDHSPKCLKISARYPKLRFWG